MEEKKVQLADRERQLQELTVKYKELEGRLATRTDELSKKAREALSNGELEEAEVLLKQSIAKQQATLADDYFNLAKAQALQLKYRDALESYQQAATLAPENSLYLNEYGVHLRTLGQYREAIAVFEKALEIDLEEKGTKHPWVAIRWNNLGEAWRSLGEYEKALKVFQTVLGDSHPNTKVVQENLDRARKRIKN